MKNILIPTDFSDIANNAFLFALELANNLNVNLLVLNTYTPPVLSAMHEGQPDALAEVYQKIELAKFDYFKKQVPKLRELASDHNLSSDNLTFIFEDGSVTDAVKKVIQKEDIHFVVMGTHGASGFEEKWIGTNTVNVINNIKVPVLAIPQNASYSTFKKIAFTTLFREKDQAALVEVTNIAKLFHAQIYCVNVLNDTDKAADALLYSDEWSKTFGDSKLDFVFLEQSGSTEQTITNFISENNIDLLAVVKRNRNFWEKLVSSSLSNKLAFHTHIPVLVFHEE